MRRRIHDSNSRGLRGFSAIELLVASSLVAIVLAGVLAAYLFVGGNLARLFNLQHQETESRRTLRQFREDAGAAIRLETAMPTQLTLTRLGAHGPKAVSYAFSPGEGRVVRTENGVAEPLLTGVTRFAIHYFDHAGTPVVAQPQAVRAVEFSFCSTLGRSGDGTLARYTTVSPRFVLRESFAAQ